MNARCLALGCLFWASCFQLTNCYFTNNRENQNDASIAIKASRARKASSPVDETRKTRSLQKTRRKKEGKQKKEKKKKGKKDEPEPRLSTPSPTPVTTMGQGNTFPATNGQTSNMLSQSGLGPRNVVCGAIQAVLAHPTDPDICFAGAVNGGVWRTDSCMAAEPDWRPLTDNEESLSVGDMVFDEEDESGNTIVVAVGTRSSFSQSGGPAIGLLYTKNALASNPTWQVLDNAAGTVNFRDRSVKFNSVVARGSLMMATAYLSDPFTCANVGVFRSVDGGVTWANVISGEGRAIASDPNDSSRFYATLDSTGLCSQNVLPPNGVFTSIDFGATWIPTDPVPDTTPIGTFQLNNAKLSVSADGSRVWSALLKNGVVDSISYSDDGLTWTKMDDVLTPNPDGSTDGLNPRVKPGGQGSIHFALLASPKFRNEVYVAGDRQNLVTFPNYIGATDFTGRLFRGDSNAISDGEIPSPQWEHLTNNDNVGQTPGGGTGTNSGPHADGRDMEFRVDGSLLEGDDGGITIRTNPSSNSGDWFGLCGNMQAFETHNVAYEPILRTVLFGNQDTGSIAGTLGSAGPYTTLLSADGSDCMIDYTSDPELMFLYYGTQTYRNFVREAVDKATGTTASVSFLELPQLAGFVSVAALNPFDATVFAVATDETEIMLSRDRGNSFDDVYATPLTDIITAMVWSADGTLLYVTDGSSVARCLLNPTDLDCGTVVASDDAFGASSVRHLTMDPSDNSTVFAASTANSRDFSSPAVFMSTDGGATWNDISVPGSLLNTASLGGSVAYISKASVSTVAVGTSNGVLVPDGGVGSGWRVLSPGLPKVAVLDMVYEPIDDTLVVATLGRGVWFVDKASELLVDLVPVGANDGQWNPVAAAGVSQNKTDDLPPKAATLGVESRPTKAASSPKNAGIGFDSILREHALLGVPLVPPESEPDDDVTDSNKLVLSGGETTNENTWEE